MEDDEFEVCPGVRMVHTPGHCPEQCSVFVQADRRYAIAGDTIPLEDNFVKDVPPALNYDAGLAKRSMDRVRRYADVIVPGHGFPFMAD